MCSELTEQKKCGMHEVIRVEVFEIGMDFKEQRDHCELSHAHYTTSCESCLTRNDPCTDTGIFEHCTALSL